MEKMLSNSSSLTNTADKQYLQLLTKITLILVAYLVIGFIFGVVYTYLSGGNKTTLLISSLFAPLIIAFTFFLCLTESVEKQNTKGIRAFIGTDIIIFLLSLSMPIFINIFVKSVDIENVDLLLKHKYFSIIYVLIAYLIIYIFFKIFRNKAT